MEAKPTTTRRAIRNRHIPRVCRNCHAPMARQEDSCWRCGTQWASEDDPGTTLTLIAGGASDRAADRWANEGGSVAAEAAAPVP
jgi:RNA polymerase subunit RPABC4/transcription elongation factor Spt4